MRDQGIGGKGALGQVSQLPLLGGNDRLPTIPQLIECLAHGKSTWWHAICLLIGKRLRWIRFKGNTLGFNLTRHSTLLSLPHSFLEH